jgi:hypothetical protein
LAKVVAFIRSVYGAAPNAGNDKVWSDGVDAWWHADHVVWWLVVDLT